MTPDLTVALGVAYVFLALLNQKAAVFVLLPVIALAPESQVGQAVIRPEDLMLSVLAVTWGFRRLLGSRQRPTPLDQPLLAYFVIGLLATLWGGAIGTADLTSLNKYSASGLHLLKRLEFVLYFFILRDTLRSITDARRLMYVFMASLVGLSLYSFGRFQETGSIALGPTGTPVHEPGLASMLNVALALGLLVGPGGVAQSGIAVAVLLGSLYTLPFGLGRDYLSSTLVMLTVVALWRKRSVLLLLPLTFVVIWLAGVTLSTLYPQNVLARFLTLGSVFAPHASIEGVSLIDRFRPGIEHSWQVLTSSPLLGWGLGSVALGSIDSEYAGQLTYTGMIGFAVFLWVVSRVIRTARETYRVAKAQGSPALPLIAGLQHCLLGYALYSTFSPSISAARAGAFFFTIIGLVAVLHAEVVPAPEASLAAESAEGMVPYAGGVGHPEEQWTA